ncbi:MAG: alpha/beta hydrolase [Candidatus Dadabacteria bacterium]|nr:MAG: alpha/beta hydrolase [Candidatus Dadabacteria bacterium]
MLNSLKKLDEDTYKALVESAVKYYGIQKLPSWLKAKTLPNFSFKKSCNQGPSAPNLLLLHGLMGAVSNWNDTFQRFSKFCNVWALEFPILELDKEWVDVFSLTLYTECFVRAYKLAPVVLCGNSMGGHIAIRLTLARPELVDCLILSGSSGLYENNPDAFPIKINREFVEGQIAQVFHNKEFITDELVDEVLNVLLDKGNVAKLVRAAKSAKKDNLLSELHKISSPTLLLWGENDMVTDIEVAKMFKENIPNSTLKTVAECGHAPMIEHPSWFAKEVKDFLEENSDYFK